MLAAQEWLANTLILSAHYIHTHLGLSLLMYAINEGTHVHCTFQEFVWVSQKALECGREEERRELVVSNLPEQRATARLQKQKMARDRHIHVHTNSRHILIFHHKLQVCCCTS